MSERVSLSYENFPHIWEGILEHVHSDVIRKVRQVSRALCHAVDGRVGHLMLLEPPSVMDAADPWLDESDNARLMYRVDALAGWVEGWAVDGRYSHVIRRTFDSLQVLEHCGPGSNEEYHLACNEEDKVKRDGERFPFSRRFKLSQMTKTIDIVGYLRPDYLDPRLLVEPLYYFQRLKTVRLIHRNGMFTPYIAFPADTVVLFPSVFGLAANKSHPSYVEGRAITGADRKDFTPWPTPRPPPFPSLLDSLMPTLYPFPHSDVPERVSRIVINLYGRSANPGDSFHILYTLKPAVRDVVIILPHYASIDDNEGSYYDPPDAFDPWDLVPVLCSPWARYTIVGADTVRAGCARAIRAAVRQSTLETVFGDVDYSLNTRRGPKLNKSVRAEHQRRAEELRAKECRLLRSRYPDLDLTLPCVSLADKLKGRMDRLEFLTLQEYRARVGDEDAALHATVTYEDSDIERRRHTLLQRLRSLTPPIS